MAIMATDTVTTMTVTGGGIITVRAATAPEVITMVGVIGGITAVMGTTIKIINKARA